MFVSSVDQVWVLIYAVGLILVIAGVVAIILICKTTRTAPEGQADVKPGVLPFKSREEYLQALCSDKEEDLEILLDRAYITEKEVIRKKKSVIEDSNELFQVANSLIDKVSNSWSQMIELKKMEIVSLDQKDLKVGCWYRDKSSGELIRLGKLAGSIAQFTGRCSNHNYGIPSSLIEFAIPKAGEWWDKKLCAQSHCRPGVRFVVGRQQWRHCDNDYAFCKENLSEERAACECGCLVPFNFGKGEITEAPGLTGVFGGAGALGAGITPTASGLPGITDGLGGGAPQPASSLKSILAGVACAMAGIALQSF